MVEVRDDLGVADVAIVYQVNDGAEVDGLKADVRRINLRPG